VGRLSMDTLYTNPASQPLQKPEASTASPHSRGLIIDSIFFEPQPTMKTPRGSVQWAKRTARLKNQDGDAIFEQHDVIAPDTWSQTAINIVASKYFYGDIALHGQDPHKGGRESDVWQMITRVAKTISLWGQQKKYFASQEDARRFWLELSWLLLHQYGSFNSPVWFNVGLNAEYHVTDTSGRTIYGWNSNKGEITSCDPYVQPQASACFIIAVEDSIDDIWRLMGESARLFKYGSGVGADWSRLRSSHEKLSGGGVPSGPVSFMRVQDATGGTIKSGGKTRRAAIMQTLKVWHPDIDQFIVCKQVEEKKAWALIEQGYDGSFNGDAYGSVAFQNVNQSVRLTDIFMKAVEAKDKYMLLASNGDIPFREVDAASILGQIAEGTHLCGDPGVQYEDTIQAWHTCPNTGPINSSNPCSEYMFLDNSACNLASLNLKKFLRGDGSGTIDTDRLRAASRIFITAMDILVDCAGYPSRAIAKNSHEYRPLGLGFANLGALLMSMGLPYDSHEGRAVAGGLMGIIHAEAYAQSADIASINAIGPFKGYAANQEPMLKVIQKHYEHAVRASGDMPKDLATAMMEAMESMKKKGLDHGYRNSQVTVLAPTGTISFMMDCDTSGIEPDIALVKYKLLAGEGDGLMKLVNQSVKPALATLGYTAEEQSAILAYVDEKDTIEGAPHLKEEHLPVFDCAFKPINGERSVEWMGHIEMMAACQPFISGAISKTVNMPEDVEISEISDAYTEGWARGLKALAIYRENSKRSQPLSTSKAKASPDTELAKEEAEESPAQEALVPDVIESPPAEPAVEVETSHKPVRRRLPNERVAITHKFRVADHEGYLHVGLYPDTHLPGEIFIDMSKEGTTISGLIEGFAISVSMGLQYGIPLPMLVAKFKNMRFEPMGFTNNRDIPQATSILDYIAKWLEHRFASEEGRLPEPVPPSLIEAYTAKVEADA